MSRVARFEVVDKWPESVWRARLLCDLDARGRGELERAGRIRRIVSGDEVYKRGDGADAVYLLLDGEMQLTRRTEVHAGDLFGIEGWVHDAARRGETARARTSATLVEMPVHVLRRALVRAGRDADADPRLVRSALRQAITDALDKQSRAAEPAKLEALLDGVRSRALAAGETLMVGDDDAAAAVWILEGASRGELLLRPEAGAWSWHASNASWIALLSSEALTIVQVSIGTNATSAADVPAFLDPRRVLGSRSLMVLNGDACIRCGHCVTSCASAHDDGLARLVRQGPKLTGDRASAVVLPGGCGHCESAACLVECPTGALTRTDGGNVLVRADLCTGCGRCVEVCPWGNVRVDMLSIGEVAKPVAVKCDLCEGRSGGPACADGCPTGAIVRIAPAEVHAIARWTKEQAKRRTATGAVAIAALVVAAAIPLDLRSSGVTASILFVAAWAHAVAKKRSRRVQQSLAWHEAVGGAAAGVVARHVGLSIWQTSSTRSPSALALVALLALASGVLGAILSRVAPPRLSRLGDDGALPETLRDEASADERTFALLSGAPESLKALWRLQLAPYAGSRFGAVAALFVGPTLATEEARLVEYAKLASHGRIDATAAGPLVTHAVALRSRRVRRLWHHLLRGWLPLHVAASVVSMALAAAHVAKHLLYK